MAALAGEVVRWGVAATVVATRDFAELVTDQGATFAPIPADSGDAIGMTASRVGARLIGTGVGQALMLSRWMRAIAAPAAETVLAAVRPGDTVLGGVLARDLMTSVVAARGGRAMTVLFTGQLPTAHRDSHFSFDQFRSSERYNRWGTRFGWQLATGLGRAPARIARERLGLPQRGAAAAVRDCDRHSTMVAASPLIVPPAPDWPPGTHQTGYPVAPPAPYDPPPDLADFLDAGPPPAYVGFGTMGTGGRLARPELVAEAARLAGHRVVTPALGAPGRLAPGVLAIGPTQHEWLFPRMAGVVHHGGAGTTYAALRAGVPSVAVPFGVDQPYHADRIHALGVGPRPLPVQRLSAARLAGLLLRLTESPYAARAAEIGTLARAEDGLGASVALLDRLRMLA